MLIEAKLSIALIRQIRIVDAGSAERTVVPITGTDVHGARPQTQATVPTALEGMTCIGDSEHQHAT